MSRKGIKLILLIAGIAVAGTGLVIQGLSFTMPGVNGFIGMFFPALMILPGIIPLIIVSLMHSKDIRETKRGLSGFLKGLAFFWIITGALNTVALIMISILFMK
jgi:hypothetical protein